MRTEFDKDTFRLPRQESRCTFKPPHIWLKRGKPAHPNRFPTTVLLPRAILKEIMIIAIENGFRPVFYECRLEASLSLSGTGTTYTGECAYTENEVSLMSIGILKVTSEYSCPFCKNFMRYLVFNDRSGYNKRAII